jgi:DNA-binding SARP family transcriptional activator
VQVRVLGEVCVEADGTTWRPSAPRERSILALLASHAGARVSGANLVDALWPNEPPPNARKAVQNYVARLRKQLPDGVVETVGDGYRLAGGIEVDALVFERLVAERRGDQEALQEALQLWRGDPCELPPSEVRRLMELRSGAEEDLADARLASGDHAAVVSVAARAAELEPLRERRWAQLMVALYRCGRQAEALEAFRRCRSYLISQLGVEPGVDLKELEARVLAQDPSLSWHPRPLTRRVTLPGPLAEATRAPMVGRASELAELRRAWHEVAASQRRTVVVTGEAGAGKSRLSAALAEHARPDAAAILCGRCQPELNLPFQPFAEALGPLDAADGDGHLAQYELFQRVVAQLAATAETGPVLLVIEDAHWATPPTRRLLRYLAAAPELAGVLLLVTQRDPVTELAELSTVRRIPLGPLTVDEVAEWTNDDRTEAVRLRDLTGGNPFLIEQLLAGGGTGPGRDVIAARLAGLSQQTRQVLELAATAGPTFQLSIVAHAHGDRGVVLDALETAEAAGLIVPQPAEHGTFSFCHALMRDALTEAIPTTRSMRLHRDLAGALESSPTRDTAALARHFAVAAPLGPHEAAAAASYALQAGRRSRATLAFEEAADYFGIGLDALRFLDTTHEEMRCDLLTARGEALHRAGDPAHRTLLDEAAALARQLHDSRRLAEVVFSQSRLGFGFDLTGADDAVARLATEAIEAVGGDQPALRARLLAVLATELIYSSEDDRRLKVCTQALHDARRSGDDRVLLHTLINSVTAWADPYDLDGRLAKTEEAARLADATDDVELGYRAHHLLALARIEAADLDGYDAARRRAEALSERLHQPSIRAEVMANDAADLYVAGDAPGAEQLVERALAVARRGGLPDTTVKGIRAACLGALYWDAGRGGEMLPVVEHLAALNRRSPWPFVTAMYHCESGDTDAARRELQELAAHDFGDVPRRSTWSLCIDMAAQVATDLDETEICTSLLALFRPFTGRVLAADPIRYDLADRVLGRLCTTTGRLDEAAIYLDKAERLAERMGAPFFTARIQVDRARLAHAQGDRINQKRFADLAMALATSTGAAGIAAAARRAQEA